ncbi:hypothetical protein QR680_003056 [Steinernema hermaphroditum]|uniref:G-protein coupled receptors family 1 profile domain-containing protein n=1 Tax=Steinernema hermaphroditum TaxID=289476 RepID=A0AA39H5D8_9BILA|nr:hypothetical protein QR680_003056 [Steinernema hermaphroditum]
MASCNNGVDLLSARFVLVGLIGSSVALFGLLANAALATLFVSRATFRHSPFFFLGFVAVFDTLLDLVYLMLLSSPIVAEYYQNEALYTLWVSYVRPIYLLGQVFKITSVLCLIVASFERYFMTRHWTFTGFSIRTRWAILFSVIVVAISVKLVTSNFQDIVLIIRPQCRLFRRYTVGNLSERAWLSGLVNTVTIFVPFLTLVFLNGGIVFMLRKQNIQQLRSLITELTMGHDVMKIRRKNLRSATNTLIIIITAYLISNLLNLSLTLIEFFIPEFLQQTHRSAYRLAADCASVLTVFGNAIRCPAHFLSNSEIRVQFWIMIFGENEKNEKIPAVVRRRSERIDNPWFSLLLSVHNEEDNNCESDGLTKGRKSAIDRTLQKRNSTIGIC